MNSSTRVIALSLPIFLHLIPALADGCYVPKLDQGSYARDISEPSQKAIICHFGNKERLILQVSYKGDVKEFCWLIPTPTRPKVNIMNEPYFHALHYCTAPQIKYWLDADRGIYFNARAGGGSDIKVAVEVLEQKTVGDYDVTVLSASNSSALLQWLSTNGYTVTKQYTPVFDHYLKRGWVFTAAKINTGSLKQASIKLQHGTIAPLLLDFNSNKPIYPLKISSLNPGHTNILLYFIGKKRMDCSGFKTECFLSSRAITQTSLPSIH